MDTELSHEVVDDAEEANAAEEGRLDHLFEPSSAQRSPVGVHLKITEDHGTQSHRHTIGRRKNKQAHTCSQRFQQQQPQREGTHLEDERALLTLDAIEVLQIEANPEDVVACRGASQGSHSSDGEEEELRHGCQVA